MPSADKTAGKTETVVSRSALQKAHTIVFDQAFSACGDYLTTCDNHGFISVFRLTSVMSHQATDEDFKPYYTFKACDDAVYSFYTHDDYLLCGSAVDIRCYRWSKLIAKNAKLEWSWTIPSQHGGLGSCEANSILVCADGSGTQLYAGCGDGCVHSWDLSSGQYLSVLGRHDNVIYDLSLQSSAAAALVYSASEDGTVKAWDMRTPRAEPQYLICPSKEEGIARPKLGRWLSSVCTQDDLIACGGGPRLSIWSSRTLTPLVSMRGDSDTNSQPYSLLFHDDMLLSGGTGKSLDHWYINGEKKSSVPVNPVTAYSIARNDSSDTSKQVLTVAGSSHLIDVCLNIGYTSFSFQL